MATGEYSDHQERTGDRKDVLNLYEVCNNTLFRAEKKTRRDFIYVNGNMLERMMMGKVDY